jgi:hypothetical protein
MSCSADCDRFPAAEEARRSTRSACAGCLQPWAARDWTTSGRSHGRVAPIETAREILARRRIMRAEARRCLGQRQTALLFGSMVPGQEVELHEPTSAQYWHEATVASAQSISNAAQPQSQLPSS